MHTYIYIKQKNEKLLYIYTKFQTLFKKQNNLRCVFIHRKPGTLPYAIFHKCLKFAFLYIQRAGHSALREFLYTKILTLRKKQDNLRYVFNIQKA